MKSDKDIKHKDKDVNVSRIGSDFNIARKRQRYDNTIKVTLDYAFTAGIATTVIGIHILNGKEVYTYISREAFDRDHQLLKIEGRTEHLPTWFSLLAKTANIEQFWQEYESYYSDISTIIDIDTVADLFYDNQVILYTAANTEKVFTKRFTETQYVAHRINTVDFGDGIGIMRDPSTIESVSLNNINQSILSIHLKITKLLTYFSTHNVKGTLAWKELKDKFFR